MWRVYETDNTLNVRHGTRQVKQKNAWNVILRRNATLKKSKEKILQRYLGSDSCTTSIMDTFIEGRYDVLELMGSNFHLVYESKGKRFDFTADLILRPKALVKSESGKRYARYTMTGMKQLQGMILWANESEIDPNEPLGFPEALLLSCQDKIDHLKGSSKGYVVPLNELIFVEGQSSDARNDYGFGYTDMTFYMTHVRIYFVEASDI